MFKKMTEDIKKGQIFKTSKSKFSKCHIKMLQPEETINMNNEELVYEVVIYIKYYKLQYITITHI